MFRKSVVASEQADKACCYSAKSPVSIAVLHSRSNAVNSVGYGRQCGAKTLKGALKAGKNYPNELESRHEGAMSPAVSSE